MSNPLEKDTFKIPFNDVLMKGIPLSGFKRGDFSFIAAHTSPEIRAKASSGFLSRLLLAHRNGLITFGQLQQQVEDHLNSIPHYDYEAPISQETIDKFLAHLPSEPVKFDVDKILEAIKANPDNVTIIDSFSNFDEKESKE